MLKNLVIRLQKYSFSKSIIMDRGLNVFYPHILSIPDIGSITTPSSLVSLVVELAEVRKNERVLDPACGIGNFLIESCIHGAKATGLDISPTAVELAKINTYLRGLECIKIFQQDSLQPLTKFSDESSQEVRENAFDVVIVQPPWGVKIQDEKLDYYEVKKQAGEMIENLFLEQCIKFVRIGGRVVIILPDSLLSNVSSRKVREFLLEYFNIEAVISLSDRLFSFPAKIKTSVLLLKREQVKEPKRPVFFARQTDYDNKLRTRKSSTDEFREILKAYHQYKRTGDFASRDHPLMLLTQLSKDKRLDFDYYDRDGSIDFSRYQARILSEIADLQLGGKIDQMQIKKGMFSIALARGENIKDYTIDLSSDDEIKIDREWNYKYIAKENDILMTRVGNPGKAGIIEDNTVQVLVSGNIIRIRADPTFVDPYYLLAFLVSREGQEMIRRKSTGAAVMALSLQNLSSLQVPIPPMKEQKEIADKIKELLQFKKKVKRMQSESARMKEAVDANIRKLLGRSESS